MSVPYNHKKIEKNGRKSGMITKHLQHPKITANRNITRW